MGKEVFVGLLGDIFVLYGKFDEMIVEGGSGGSKFDEELVFMILVVLVELIVMDVVEE